MAHYKRRCLKLENITLNLTGWIRTVLSKYCIQYYKHSMIIIYYASDCKITFDVTQEQTESLLATVGLNGMQIWW